MATFIEVHENNDDGEPGLVHYINIDHIIQFYPLHDDRPQRTVILLSAVDPYQLNTMLVNESVQLIMDRIRNATRGQP